MINGDLELAEVNTAVEATNDRSFSGFPLVVCLLGSFSISDICLVLIGVDVIAYVSMLYE
jgi:hypothetical protein